MTVEVCVRCMCDKLSPLLCSLPVCNSPSKTKTKKKSQRMKKKWQLKNGYHFQQVQSSCERFGGNTTHVEISAPGGKWTAFGTQCQRELSEITEKQVKRRKKLEAAVTPGKLWVNAGALVTDKLHLSRVRRRFLFTTAAQSNTSSFIPWTSAKQQLNPGANKAIPKKRSLRVPARSKFRSIIAILHG